MKTFLITIDTELDPALVEAGTSIHEDDIVVALFHALNDSHAKATFLSFIEALSEDELRSLRHCDDLR